MIRFDKFRFNLQVCPDRLIRLLYPVWWIIWMLLFLLYLAVYILAKFFQLIRWIFTPKKKAEKKAVAVRKESDRKTRK